MSGAAWSDVWSTVLTLMAHQSVPVNLFTVLAAAFFVTMSLEGIRASFFTGRAHPISMPAAAETAQAEEPGRPDEPSEDMRTAAPDEIAAPDETTIPEAAPEFVRYVPAQAPAFDKVNTPVPRRSNPRKPKILRLRKPSGEKFI